MCVQAGVIMRVCTSVCVNSMALPLGAFFQPGDESGKFFQRDGWFHKLMF